MNDSIEENYAETSSHFFESDTEANAEYYDSTSGYHDSKINPYAELCRYYRFIFSVVITGGLSVVGIVGNVLALFVLRRFREKATTKSGSSPTAIILSVLAIMDTLVLVSLLLVKSLPSLFYFFHIGEGYLAISPYLWQWGWPLNDLFHAYSTWITVLVAMQRCVAVNIPHKAVSLCSLKLTWALLAFIFVAVALFQSPTFLDYKLISLQNDQNETYLARVYTHLGQNHLYQIAYKTTAYYLVIYIIPLFALIVLSFLLVRGLHKAKAKRSEMTRDTSSKEDDVTKSLILIVLVCILCQPWEPIRRILEALLKEQPGCGHFYFFFEEFPSLSFAFNSAVNFIIYYLSGVRFRLILRELLSCNRAASKYSEDNFGSQSISSTFKT